MELSSFFHLFLYLRRHTGFVAIGCEIAFSTAAASTIHTSLAPFTNPVCTLALLYPVSKFVIKTCNGSFLPLAVFYLYSMQPGALPPYVNIYVEYIHKAIHGSDTGAYDSKGR
jgi:peroxygenase